MFSILIATKNEEENLPKCLESLKDFDDIIVYDSYSEDKTREICNRYNVRFVQRPDQNRNLPFGGDEAFHRNWALKNIKYKYKWLFILDADERLSKPLKQEILEFLKLNDAQDIITPAAFRVKRRDYFLGKRLRFTQSTSKYIRLCKPNLINYQRIINCNVEVLGHISEFKGYINHYPFSKGVSHWISKHNTYSSYEAKQIFLDEINKSEISIPKALFSKSLEERQKERKKIYYKIPARPLIKFLYLYIFKLGFLDSYRGLLYSTLMIFYEFMIIIKSKELHRKRD